MKEVHHDAHLSIFVSQISGACGKIKMWVSLFKEKPGKMVSKGIQIQIFLILSIFFLSLEFSWCVKFVT